MDHSYKGEVYKFLVRRHFNEVLHAGYCRGTPLGITQYGNSLRWIYGLQTGWQCILIISNYILVGSLWGITSRSHLALVTGV